MMWKIVLQFIVYFRINKMAQCAHILDNGKQCKRLAESGSKYCWQHQIKTLKMSLYFDLLPSELVDLLFLYFTSYELLIVLPEIEKLPNFSHLFSSKIFWKQLWRRDISLFLPVPENTYEKYIGIFQTLSSYSNKFA